MNYLDKLDWNKIKGDLEKGLNQGLAAFRTGAIAVRKKAGELGDEGKKQYRILSLKTKMHKSMSDLGARVYSLMHSGQKNPLLDSRVKDIAAQISKHESMIIALEKTGPKTSKKTGAKASSGTRRKKASSASTRSRKR